MNRTAVLLCSGNYKAAKEELDILLSMSEVKIVTTDVEASKMVPQYLINLLVYFFLRTSKCISIILTGF